MIDYHKPPAGLFVYRTQTHFDDLDSLWMLYHARYLNFLERAQQSFFDLVMQAECFDPKRYPDTYQVVRDVQVRYLRSIDFVGPFFIAMRVAKVRAAGITMEFAFRSEDGQTLYAKGTRTACHLGEDHQPAPWSDTFRNGFEKWEREGKRLEL